MRRFVFALGMLLASLDLGAVPGEAFGSPHRMTLTKASTHDIKMGDLNGDGRQDLAVVVRNYPNWVYRIDIHLQGADGRFSAPVPVPLPEKNDEYRMALADMDGDGREEIVVGARHGWEGGGLHVVDVGVDGTASLTLHEGPPVHCRYVATGDIDRDGHADVACHDEQLSAAVYLGNGRGGFRASHAFRTVTGWYVLAYDFKTLQLADATGDGYPDLLIAAGHSYSFHVLANNRMGGFYPGVAYRTPGLVGPTSVHAADLDGDGTNEVVTATPDREPNASVRVYRLGAGGYLWLAEQIPVLHSATAVVAGPVGRAGTMSVLAAHYSMNTLTVLGEEGRGFQRQFRYELPGFGNHLDYGNQRRQFGLALGDLDGDGCNDLAVATWSGIQFLFGCEAFESSIPASDYDGDGVSDLLWRSQEQYPYQLWPWGRDDQCAFCRPTIPVEFRAQASGDFDGDGSSDLFWRDTSSGANQIMLGAVHAQPATTVTDLRWRVVAAGDFDGDDRSDLLWRHDASGAAAIWRAADHARQLRVTRVADLRWKVAATGDFDGDGRSDILWRQVESGANAIWRSANFATQQPIAAVTDTRWQVAGVGDFDGDGRSDIVWRHSLSGSNAIWLGGDHRRQRAVSAVTNLDWKVGAIGDYNGDGLSDLMWRNVRTGVNVAWLGGRVQSQQVLDAWRPAGWFLVPEAP